MSADSFGIPLSPYQRPEAPFLTSAIGESISSLQLTPQANMWALGKEPLLHLWSAAQQDGG